MQYCKLACKRLFRVQTICAANVRINRRFMSISAEIYRYYTIKAEKAGCTEAILQACLQEIVSGADYLRSKCTNKPQVYEYLR